MGKEAKVAEQENEGRGHSLTVGDSSLCLAANQVLPPKRLTRTVRREEKTASVSPAPPGLPCGRSFRKPCR